MSAFFLWYFKDHSQENTSFFSLKLKKYYTNWLNGNQPTLLVHRTAQLPLLASPSHTGCVLYKRLKIVIVFKLWCDLTLVFICSMKMFHKGRQNQCFKMYGMLLWLYWSVKYTEKNTHHIYELQHDHIVVQQKKSKLREIEESGLKGKQFFSGPYWWI